MTQRAEFVDPVPWLDGAGIEPELLRVAVSGLALPTRVLKACAALELATVGDVLGVDANEFMALFGVGIGTWSHLRQRICEVLLSRPLPAPVASGGEPILDLVTDPRARLALQRLGICTGAEFRRTARAVFLALPGFDAAVYRAVSGELHHGLDEALFTTSDDGPAPAAWAPLWPESFRCRPLHTLCLPPDLLCALADRGLHRLGDLMTADAAALGMDPHIGACGVATLRTALEAHLEPAAAGTAPPPTAAPGFDVEPVALLLAAAGEERDFLAAYLGVGCRAAASVADLGRRLSRSATEILEICERVRSNLREGAGDLLHALENGLETELGVQDGLVRTDHIGRGSPLRRLAIAAGDPLLPLRLLVLLQPERLHLDDGVLLPMPACRRRRTLQVLDRFVTEGRLPAPLATVLDACNQAGTGCLPRGALLHLVARHPRLQVVIDPLRGEVVQRRRTTIADRIEVILRSAGGPLPEADLLFRYRDRFGRGSRRRLLDHMHAEPCFLQVGPSRWDLRERHVDELGLAEQEAVRLRDLICTVGGQHRITALIEGGPVSERLEFLLRDCLRRDPAIRYLGDGRVCPRASRVSGHLDDLLRALGRAAGELPLSRFLRNSRARGRALRERLLRENRLFVEIAPDRIDLLSNYPFNPERLRDLLRVVDMHLEHRDGYDDLASVAAAVDEAGLGGSYLSLHLLRDLLRRHGQFEFLTDDLVAQRSRGLRGWIQQRARDAMRRAVRGLTKDEIVVEAPELAEFDTCVEDVVASDPMVQTPDGERYMVM